MLELTVKTLDSQNHAFTTEDDITVRGFKEQIADTVDVSASSQRLIYCGRVLQDDKKLNDYDVNGKVIHLVQRAPPQAGQTNNSNNDNGQRSTTDQGGWFHRALQYGPIHRNTMYLGAMSLPTEVVEGSALQPPQLSNTLSHGRLIIARRMLNNTIDLLDRLDDPSVPLNPNPVTETRATTSTTPLISGQNDQENDSIGSNDIPVNGRESLAQAASAIAAALSAAALNNIQISAGPSGVETVSINLAALNADPLENMPNLNVSTDSSETTQSQSQPTDTQEAPASNEGQPTPPAEPQYVPRPPQMAELLERLLTCQDRLRPYIERYRVLMSADPSLPPGSGPEGVEENQRVVDGVSEALHFLSHACHTLSDIIVDMGQQPPRNLRCRPIIMQHSAILHSGIPIQVEVRPATISLQTRNHNDNNNTSSNTTQESAESEVSTAQTTGTTSSSSSESHSQSTTETSSQEPTAPTLPTTTQSQPQPALAQLEADSWPFPAVMNLPSNVELSMFLRSQNNDEPVGSTTNTTANNNNSGSPRDILTRLQSLMLLREAVQGLQERYLTDPPTTTAPNVVTATLPGQTIDSGNATSGQSTQARSNIGTHPTTSTQTRSTSRPHVFHPHSNSMGVRMNEGVDFDPFLPCKSHHVRRTPVTTPNSTSTSQSSQSTQVPASESQTSTQPSPAMLSTAPSSSGNSVDAEQSESSQTSHPFHEFFGSNGPFAKRDSSTGFLSTVYHAVDLLNLTEARHKHIQNSPVQRPMCAITISSMLKHKNVQLDVCKGRNFLLDFAIFLADHVTLQNLVEMSKSVYKVVGQIRKRLLHFLRLQLPGISTSSDYSEVTDPIINALKPVLSELELSSATHTELYDNQIDVPRTITEMLQRHIRHIVKLLFNEEIPDEIVGDDVATVFRQIVIDFCGLIRCIIVHKKNGLMNFVKLFFKTLIGNRRFSTDTRNFLYQLFRVISERFEEYSQTVPDDDEVADIALFYKSNSASEAASSSMNAEEQNQESAKPEQMETDAVDEKMSDEGVANDEEETTTETFPEINIPDFPEWAPIIARDNATQRRQLQEIGANGATPFSDAYLNVMPSKRRKLYEQQKPRLLMSPTPNNSAVTTSMERLVREGVSHAGIEEVEGATVAVANDSGVRSAFGQAIRDCLPPGRFRTPDFPDATRFPNATKYFATDENQKQ